MNEIIKRILLVEDDILIATLEKMELEKKGYIVHRVGTGEEAVKTIIDNMFPIDLILMDIDLGSGIDGTQAAEQILKYKDIPVVFLSSHIEPEVVEKTEKITSYGYVVKNSGIVVLDACIKMALKLAHAKNECEKTEQESKNRESFLSKVFDILPIGMWYADENGKLLRGNAAGVKIWGAEPKVPMEEYGVFKARYYESREEITPDKWSLVRTIKEKVTIKDEILEIDAFDGLKKIISNYTSPVLDDKGNLLGAIIINNDITERIRAEEMLKVSEKLLAETEIIGKVGGWSFNIDTMEQKWTDEVYRIHEVEIEPNPSVDAGINFYTKESRSIIEKAVQRAIEHGENFDLELEIITAKGNKRAVHTIGKADLKNRRIHGFFQDITDRKIADVKLKTKTEELEATNEELEATNEELNAAMEEMEAANDELIKSNELLQKSEERYRLHFLNMSSYNSMYEVVKSKEGEIYDFRFIMVNPAYEEYVGIKSSDLIGKTLLEVYPDTEQYWIDKMKEAVISGTPLHFENFSKVMNIYTEINLYAPQKDKLVMTTANITARKQAEESLRESEEKFRLITEQTNALTAITDMNGIITYASSYSKTLFQFDPNEMCGRNFIEFLEKSDIPHAFAMFSEVIKNGAAAQNLELAMRRKDGSTFIGELNGMRFQQGALNGTIVIIYDITDRKIAEDEIKKQLTEKEILLREIHHRVKNNIVIIEIILSLQANSTTTPEVQTALEDAMSRVQSMWVLYDKLLVTNEYNNISIKSYTESLIDSFVIVFDVGKNIIIEKHLSDFTISAKKAMSVGIIINELMTNIFKYAFEDCDNCTVSISIEKLENRVTLIIQDNGIGIDDKIAVNQSSGFGLTIVKMLTEQLKGTYTIENANGTRSTLKFDI